MPYFVPYFVFDPSVKFRFKTQCCAIDGIDAILSRGKMKKSGYGREKYGSWRKNNKNPVRIYAIYGIYGTHCVSERVAGVATGGKWSVWGNYNRWGVLQSLLPHTMEKHQRSGLRWSAGIIPHLVQECQPQHSALW